MSGSLQDGTMTPFFLSFPFLFPWVVDNPVWKSAVHFRILHGAALMDLNTASKSGTIGDRI